MPIRLLLADDHPVIRQGIRSVLEMEKDFEIISEFKSGKALINSPLIYNSDVLLLDLNMPNIDGIQVLKTIKAAAIPLKTIIISAYNSTRLIEECREFGACAYVLKTEQLSHLREVIMSVMNGELIFPLATSSDSNINDKFSYLDDFLTKYKLTKREVEIIRLVCKGMTSAEIAEKLFLSIFTVQTHRKNILRKLSIEHSNPMSLFEFATKNGILRPNGSGSPQ